MGFGGTGAHYCIGANLARMTIDLMFNAIADAMPDLASIGKPERLRSGWLNGIKHWQVDYHSTAQRNALSRTRLRHIQVDGHTSSCPRSSPPAHPWSWSTSKPSRRAGTRCG